jgi:cytochrome c6
MKRTLSAAVLAAFALGAAGSARAEDAAALYNAKCAVCHAKDGKGDTAMGKKLGVKPFAASASEADLAKVTTEGKGKMPAYKGKVSDADIQALAKYMKTLK